jgi:hypothetical protein
LIWQAVVLLCFIAFSIGMYIGGHIAIDLVIKKQKTFKDEFFDKAETFAKRVVTDNIELRNKLGLPLLKEDKIFLEMFETVAVK